MASVRFICGTQEQHKELERDIAAFLGTEDTHPLFLLLRRQRRPVRNAAGRRGRRDLRRAESRLDHRRHPAVQGPAVPLQEPRHGGSRSPAQAAQSARFRLIATDGVFSMDGYIAPLRGICDLAERYHALVMVDDSHAVGFMGPTGRGTHEHRRRHGPRRYSHRHAGQGAGRRQRRLHQRAPSPSSTCCVSARAPTCFRIPSPPPSWRRRAKTCSILRGVERAAPSASMPTPRSSGGA